LLPTILTPDGPTVEGVGGELLGSLLGELEARLKERSVPVDAGLMPGLRPEFVRAMIRDEIALTAPDELVVWFSWRNGIRFAPPTRVTQVLPFIWSASLEQCIAKYKYWVEAKQSQPALGESGLWAWAESWLPLERQAHTYHISCREDPSIPPLVKRSDERYPVGKDDGHYQVRSLCTLVAWWIEAIDCGATQWIEHRQEWLSDVKILPSVQLATGMFY